MKKIIIICLLLSLSFFSCSKSVWLNSVKNKEATYKQEKIIFSSDGTVIMWEKYYNGSSEIMGLHSVDVTNKSCYTNKDGHFYGFQLNDKKLFLIHPSPSIDKSYFTDDLFEFGELVETKK